MKCSTTTSARISRWRCAIVGNTGRATSCSSRSDNRRKSRVKDSNRALRRRSYGSGTRSDFKAELTPGKRKIPAAQKKLWGVNVRSLCRVSNVSTLDGNFEFRQEKDDEHYLESRAGACRVRGCSTLQRELRG